VFEKIFEPAMTMDDTILKKNSPLQFYEHLISKFYRGAVYEQEPS
jgi:hypothetical protein